MKNLNITEKQNYTCEKDMIEDDKTDSRSIVDVVTSRRTAMFAIGAAVFGGSAALHLLPKLGERPHTADLERLVKFPESFSGKRIRTTGAVNLTDESSFLVSFTRQKEGHEPSINSFVHKAPEHSAALNPPEEQLTTDHTDESGVRYIEAKGSDYTYKASSTPIQLGSVSSGDQQLELLIPQDIIDQIPKLDSAVLTGQLLDADASPTRSPCLIVEKFE